MGTNKNKDNITLEALLRLKRDERPSSDFWDSFDNDFERRRLHALVEKDTIRRSVWIPSLKAAMVGMPAVLLLSLVAFWAQTENGSTDRSEMNEAVAWETPALEASEFVADSAESEPASQEQWLADSANGTANQFVVDAITSDSERGMNFRKVLYSPALHLSGPTGASYVRDNLSTKSYGVTMAEMKIGRNF